MYVERERGSWNIYIYICVCVSTHEVVPHPTSAPASPRGSRCPQPVSRLWAPGKGPWLRWADAGLTDGSCGWSQGMTSMALVSLPSGYD